MDLSLPIHPTLRHPLTGLPLRALWVRPDGRPCWPLMGGAPEGDDAGASNGGASGGDGGAGAGAGGDAGGSTGSGGSAPQNARDAQGRDLGFPENTPWQSMTDAQQAKYWMHNSQKHEGRYKSLVGGKSFDEAKADLDAYDQHKREQLTPSEQAIQAAREEGRTSALTESSTTAATAILKTTLKLQGLNDAEISDIVDIVDVRKFLTDDLDVDTDKLAATARRFTTPGTGGDDKRRRDFGGGSRGGTTSSNGSAGSAEADRRFGEKK